MIRDGARAADYLKPPTRSSPVPLYGHRLSGHFRSTSAAGVLSLYQEKYAPNNVFFVVVGDVRTTEVIEQNSKAYEQSKAKAMAGVVLPHEPRQTAAREIIEEAPIELGYFHIAWHIPDFRHPDTPALDVLATLLGSGHSSRLYQQVRERHGSSIPRMRGPNPRQPGSARDERHCRPGEVQDGAGGHAGRN